MSRAYTPTSKVNPCPICDNTSGKCRSKEDAGKTFFLCMTVGNARFGEAINGFKCIRENDSSKSYPATTWVVDDSTEWTEQQRAEWNRRKQERAEKKAQEIAGMKSRSLSAVQRDAGYRAILNQLELHPTDRADLLSRGFTEEEIIASGFKSVQRYQRLKSPVNPLLPGVTKGGTQLITADDGYLCPVRNVSGQIVGCQVRWRNPADGNRYAWLSGSGNVLHFFPDGSEGELPLAIHFPIKEKAKEISLIEGTGAKPFLASNRLSSVVIGAAGGLWLASRQTLKNALEVVTESNKVIIIVYPDAGDVINPQVMNRWRNTIQYFQQLGYVIAVKWWGQITKKHPDIDELEDLSQITTISVKEFFDLPKSAEVQQAIRSEKAWKFWREAKQFTGDININNRYISNAIELPQSGYCTAIYSGLGSGKTTLLYKLVQSYPDKGFLAFGARNNQVRQFAGEAGFYHLQDDLKGDKIAMKLLADPLSRILACIDSIIYFKPEDFDGKILLLDEFESTFKQLLMANTAVSQWRQKACELLIEAFKRCERIVILDGNLKDITLASLEEIFKKHGIDKKIVKIKNLDNSLTSNKVKFYLGAEFNGEINKNNRTIFLKYLLENAGKSPFVVVADSQIFLEALDNQLKDMGLSGLRIDSSTTGTEEVGNFLKDANAPKEWILRNKPDYLLLSPSLENGGNINIPGYFKNIYAYFCGVLLTDEQCQILRRVRDSEATIHIFCKPVGMPNRSVSTSPFPHEVEQTFRQYVNDCADASFQGLDHQQALLKLTQQLIEISSKGEFFQYESKVTGIANHERFHLRECLWETLKAKGYQLEFFTDCKNSDPIKTREEEVKNLISKIIAESEDTTTEKAEEILKDPRVSRDEKCKAIKRKYLDKLPGIENIMVEKLVTVSNSTSQELVTVPLFDAEFVKRITFDDRRLISNMEVFYLLQHPDQAKLIQQNRWYRMLEPTVDENPENLKLSTNYYSLWLKIKALREIGITKFFEPGTTWNSQDPRVIEIYQKAKNYKVARDIGIKPGKDTPAAFVGRLLKSLGFTTESQRVVTEEGDRERIYRVKETPFTDPVKAAILTCIERRFTAKMAETEAKNFAQILQGNEPQNACGERGSSRPPSADISLIKTEEGGRNLESQKDISEEVNPCQELADALAAAGTLEGVRALVDRHGWQSCDDAATFAPIEDRGQLRRSLKEIQLNPVQPATDTRVDAVVVSPVVSVEESIAKVKAEAEVKPLVPIGSEVWILKEGRWKGFSGKVDKILSSIAVRCQITVAGFRSWVELAAGEFTTDWYEFKRQIV